MESGPRSPEWQSSGSGEARWSFRSSAEMQLLPTAEGVLSAVCLTISKSQGRNRVTDSGRKVCELYSPAQTMRKGQAPAKPGKPRRWVRSGLPLQLQQPTLMLSNRLAELGTSHLGYMANSGSTTCELGRYATTRSVRESMTAGASPRTCTPQLRSAAAKRGSPLRRHLY